MELQARVSPLTLQPALPVMDQLLPYSAFLPELTSLEQAKVRTTALQSRISLCSCLLFLSCLLSHSPKFLLVSSLHSRQLCIPLDTVQGAPVLDLCLEILLGGILGTPSQHDLNSRGSLWMFTNVRLKYMVLNFIIINLWNNNSKTLTALCHWVSHSVSGHSS